MFGFMKKKSGRSQVFNYIMNDSNIHWKEGTTYGEKAQKIKEWYGITPETPINEGIVAFWGKKALLAKQAGNNIGFMNFTACGEQWKEIYRKEGYSLID